MWTRSSAFSAGSQSAPSAGRQWKLLDPAAAEHLRAVVTHHRLPRRYAVARFIEFDAKSRRIEHFDAGARRGSVVANLDLASRGNSREVDQPVGVARRQHDAGQVVPCADDDVAVHRVDTNDIAPIGERDAQALRLTERAVFES